MTRPTDPRTQLAADLRQLATALTNTDPQGAHLWHPQGRHQRDALALIRAGAAMLTHGDQAERLAHDWAATGLTTTSNQPGITEGCGCDDNDDCPHGTTTERGALNGPDQWATRAARLRQQRELLADNAVDYANLVHLVTTIGERLGRVSTVDTCAGCGDPIPDSRDRPKRLDGEPYHNTTDRPCWWRAYNATRGRRGA